ncbi:hypothetical protein [Arthrobacter sp. MDT1-65]
MSEVVDDGAADESAPKGFTADDLRLGRKVSRHISILSAAALVACVLIAGFVFLNVPWDTRMPYDGKYERSGKGLPMQIALLPALVLLVRIWWDGKKPDAHHMRKGSRVGAYIVCGALIGACVVLQWNFAESILEAGGYLAG